MAPVNQSEGISMSAAVKEVPQDPIFRSYPKNVYAEIAAQFDVVKQIVEHMIRCSREETRDYSFYPNEAGKTYPKTDDGRHYRLGHMFRFSFNVDFYDYKPDGNTKAGFGERTAIVDFTVIHAHVGTMWVKYDVRYSVEKDDPENKLFVNSEGWTILPDALYDDLEPGDFHMTGNHDSCWNDGWDRLVRGVVGALYTRIAPANIDTFKYGHNPVSIRFWMPGWGRFHTPVWVLDEPDDANARGRMTGGYVRRIADLADRNGEKIQVRS